MWRRKTGESTILLISVFKRGETTVEHPSSFGDASEVKLKAEQYYMWPKRSEGNGYIVGIATGNH